MDILRMKALADEPPPCALTSPNHAPTVSYLADEVMMILQSCVLAFDSTQRVTQQTVTSCMCAKCHLYNLDVVSPVCHP